MITKEQADAASDVLLQEGLAAQAAQTAKLARRRQILFAFRWVSVGAMLGFSVDDLLRRSNDSASSWIIVAAALTLAATTIQQMRKTNS